MTVDRKWLETAARTAPKYTIFFETTGLKVVPEMVTLIPPGPAMVLNPLITGFGTEKRSRVASEINSHIANRMLTEG